MRPHIIPKTVLNEMAEHIYEVAGEAGGSYVQCFYEVDRKHYLYELDFHGVAHSRTGCFRYDFPETCITDIIPTWMEIRAYNEEGDEVAIDFSMAAFTKDYLTNLIS